MFFYIGDTFVFARSLDEALRLCAVCLELFHRIGFRVSLKKSLLSPGQLVKHLGFLFHVRDCMLWVTTQPCTLFITQPYTSFMTSHVHCLQPCHVHCLQHSHGHCLQHSHAHRLQHNLILKTEEISTSDAILYRNSTSSGFVQAEISVRSP